MPLVGYKSAGGGLSPRTYYLEDDWDDNALSSRSNADAGAWFYQPAASQPGDTLVGRYRPVWETNSGSPSATSGYLSLPDGSTTMQMVLTDDRMASGSWQYDQVFANSPSSGAFAFSILGQSKNTAKYRLNKCYFQHLPDTGGHNFFKENGGTTTELINASRSTSVTTKATFETTRDENGNFEIFEDGVSAGTATDTTFTESFFEAPGSNADVETRVDNLRVS